MFTGIGFCAFIVCSAAFVNAELFHLLATETGLWHHPFDRMLEDILWLAGDHRRNRELL